MFRATERLLAAQAADGVETRLVTVGKKAQGYFRFRGQEVEQSFLGMSERPTFADAREVAAAAVDPVRQRRGRPGRSSSPPGSSAPAPRRSRCASSCPSSTPATPSRRPSHEHERRAAGTSPPTRSTSSQGYTEFEPDAAVLLVDLAPRAAETEIFAALLEASASELTARQRAMAAATENAGELIKKYSRIMNRARQDTITTEIMEIVGGAEALRAGAEGDEGGLVIETRV